VEDALGTVKRYYVIFDPKGGSMTDAYYMYARGVESGVSLGARFPEDPKRTGYAFLGWFDDETQYSASTAIYKNMTLTAKWQSAPLRTVSFDANGGTPDNIAPVTVDSGTSIGTKMPAPPTKNGYRFVGWFAGETRYGADTKIANTVTLTATWEAGTGIYDTRDGKDYKTVAIGGKMWMAKNLDYETSANSWCYYNRPDSCAKYGRLYTWNMARTVCPSGWHLPKEDEWKALIKSADSAVAGKNLKATSGWSGDGNGADVFGFSAMPGGYRSSGGSFSYAGTAGYWWTADSYENYNSVDGIRIAMTSSSGLVSVYGLETTSGVSVRCVQNN